MRTGLAFPCGEEILAGTLDFGARPLGLLIVTGGTQIRIGAHRMQALLAAEVAARGFPVFRFDRRGIGDSGGDDPGFRASAPDIITAVAAFRAAMPGMARIAGFGLCDGASALALHHRAAGIEALILANPWVVEPERGLPPPAAIRRRYHERLRSIEAWKRLLTGKVDLSQLGRGLRAAGVRRAGALTSEIAGALAGSAAPVDLLIARGDATAIAFEAEYARPAFATVRRRARCHPLDSASHSFASADDRAWLHATVLEILERLAGE